MVHMSQLGRRIYLPCSLTCGRVCSRSAILKQAWHCSRSIADFRIHDSSFMSMDIVDKLRTFIENEMKSCSMDIGGITPLYVYRMWGGKFSIEEIESGLREIRNQKLAVE